MSYLHTFTPRTPVDNELAPPPENFKKKDWAEKAYEIAQEMRQEALENQKAAANSQRKTYNKGLKPTIFNVGDYVRVKDPTAESKEAIKLRNQYVGPFRIRALRIRGRKGILWELEDEKDARLKGYYHPSKLKLVNEERRSIEENRTKTMREASSTEGEV